MNAVIATGQPLRFFDQTRRRTFQHAFYPILGDDGTVNRFAAYSRDVTVERETQKERDLLATAVAQSHEIIVVTDREGTMLYVNPAFERTTGYSREEAIGQNPRILKSGIQDRNFYAQMWATLLSGHVWEGQMVNRKKDGGLFTDQSVISPVLDPSGAITAFVAAKRDVTQEIELQKAIEQARNLQTIGMIAGGVAHEVRNPLFAIATVVAALEKKLKGREEFGEYVNHIQEHTRRLNALMNDLLSLGRAVDPAQFTALDIGELLRHTVELARQGSVRGCPCVLDLAESTLRVQGLSDKLEQVFLNLIQNAVSFTPEGSQVSIHAWREKDQVCVALKDQGLGIPPEMFPKLFLPFSSKREGGTGLGLAIAQKLVLVHGGSIFAANNDPPPGSTFTVRLPIFLRAAQGEPDR